MICLTFKVRYVTYESEEHAKQTLDDLRKKLFRGAKVHARMKTESTPRAPSYPVQPASAPMQAMMPMVPPYMYAPYPGMATGGFYGYGNGRMVPQQLPGGMQPQLAPHRPHKILSMLHKVLLLT